MEISYVKNSRKKWILSELLAHMKHILECKSSHENKTNDANGMEIDCELLLKKKWLLTKISNHKKQASPCGSAPNNISNDANSAPNRIHMFLYKEK